MKRPAEVYQPSTRPYRGLPDVDYPLHNKVVVVTNCFGHKVSGHRQSDLDRGILPT